MIQLWEYLTLTVRDGIVLSANGQMLAKESFWGTIKGQAFPNFLNELGKLGWEVVGVSSILNAAQLPVTVEDGGYLETPVTFAA